MQDFYANTSYNGASWSSDRKHILVSSNATGIWNVYAIPAAGGAPVPLTQSTTQSIFARAKVKASFEGWAGDDKSFFVSTNERDERYFDLYVRLHRVSPLFNAEKIKVPLMVLQGANDPRVLKVESEEIVAAARKNGVPVEYVIFPDEGHGFVKKENPIRGYSAVIQFLDRYLKGAAE
ncbi:MAG TPA: prolyl oligopeptidase family serine peptidase [Gemmatimonadaceae bacterium]|nr:prolyl oligopeptidase family serine peptidase [Gemmatimonadaceae bacterium]